TEGSVDLARLAGLKPAAVICEIMNDDGTMARLPDLRRFAARHGLPVLTIAELLEHRRRSAGAAAPEETPPVRRAGESRLPTEHGEFRAVAFRNVLEGTEHLALIAAAAPARLPLVRVHSECLTGDALGSR